MAGRASHVHFVAPLAVALACATGCHGDSPGPSKTIPFGGARPLEPVGKVCGGSEAAVLSPADIESACGLGDQGYLGVGKAHGCQYIWQTGPDRAYIRIQTRVGMSVAQAFEAVRTHPLSGIGDIAAEGYIREDLWIMAGQRGDRLAYVEADRRLCSEPQTEDLLRVAVGRLQAAAVGEHASVPASRPTPPRSR